MVFENDRVRVYRGIVDDGRKPVLLKTTTAAGSDSRGLDRLRREYELLASLTCPGVTRPHALLERGSLLVLVHEDNGGALLDTFIGSQPCPLATFFPLALSLVQTLECLHEQRVVHRNIQPRSILVGPAPETVQLTDFAFASRVNREQAPLSPVDGIEGSLPCLAPEQTGRMNRAVDYRTDFYALGATFYELLSGQRPFTATDTLELVHCHLARQPRPLRSIVATIPKSLAAIVAKL
jgi:serine/threonine protein kinase